VSKHQKLLEHIVMRRSDVNVSFAGLRELLLCLGFRERVTGSHHIFSADFADEILNLQPKGSLAKAYQVKQVRIVVLKYRLRLES
jgi:hypothetical protein